MTDIVERLREGVFGANETKTDAVIHSHMQAAADEIERLREQIYESIPKWQANELQREIERLRAERDMWRAENMKKQTACEQMAARIVALEWTVIVARRGGVEAAIAVASKRAASRHSEAAHCVSDRSKKHMQIRADEAGQLVADLRELGKNNHD